MRSLALPSSSDVMRPQSTESSCASKRTSRVAETSGRTQMTRPGKDAHKEEDRGSKGQIPRSPLAGAIREWAGLKAELGILGKV